MLQLRGYACSTPFAPICLFIQVVVSVNSISIGLIDIRASWCNGLLLWFASQHICFFYFAGRLIFVCLFLWQAIFFRFPNCSGLRSHWLCGDVAAALWSSAGQRQSSSTANDASECSCLWFPSAAQHLPILLHQTCMRAWLCN